jgi:acetyl-CoA acetyltransferase
MASQRSVVFAEAVRTAIGTFGGSLKELPAPNLGAVAIGAAVARAKLRPDEVETVVMGNVVQAGTKMNPARQAAVHAGLPVTTPALIVNRVCGSGAQARQAPYLVARGRWGYRLGDDQLYDSVLRDGLNDAFSDQASGWRTEHLVEKFQVTREAQEAVRVAKARIRTKVPRVHKRKVRSVEDECLRRIGCARRRFGPVETGPRVGAVAKWRLGRLAAAAERIFCGRVICLAPLPFYGFAPGIGADDLLAERRIA